VASQTGSVIDHVDYDAFGKITNETQPGNGDRWKYTAREFDGLSGLQFNRARYYDPPTGRWVSQDPAGFEAGDSNLYRYAGNGPSNNTDPSGLSPWDALIDHSREISPKEAYQAGYEVGIANGSDKTVFNEYTERFTWDRKSASGKAYWRGQKAGFKEGKKRQRASNKDISEEDLKAYFTDNTSTRTYGSRPDYAVPDTNVVTAAQRAELARISEEEGQAREEELRKLRGTFLGNAWKGFKEIPCMFIDLANCGRVGIHTLFGGEAWAP